LFVNQWVGMDIEGSRTLSDKLGAVVFLVYGAIVGYGFDLIRQRDTMRQVAEGELEIVRDREIRNAEQQRLADHLHDSVLQTLHAIRVDPGDRDRVDLVARRQERELRRTIRSFRSDFDEPFSAAMFAARDDVEELYRVEIDMVCAYDAELTAELTGIIEATKEAMINAAKHSGSDTIIVHCSAEGGDLNVLVRDRGRGFDSASAQQLNRGIENSIVRRVEKYGGSVTVQSSESFGTEVEMLIPLGSAP
jgi:signal transduction histidine kinase